jgi:ankyrin repeat protein
MLGLPTPTLRPSAFSGKPGDGPPSQRTGDGGTLTAVTTEPDDLAVRLVSADDPRAVAATVAVQAGDLDALDRLLSENPWLATARVGDWSCHRTLLHAATDWPGHFPNGPAVVERLIAAGADVNAQSKFSSHTETPLHWAASSNDVDVLEVLLDAGADIEATGAVLGGGTPLADACGFGNWAAAKRLVERRAYSTERRCRAWFAGPTASGLCRAVSRS